MFSLDPLPAAAPVRMQCAALVSSIESPLVNVRSECAFIGLGSLHFCQSPLSCDPLLSNFDNLFRSVYFCQNLCSQLGRPPGRLAFEMSTDSSVFFFKHAGVLCDYFSVPVEWGFEFDQFCSCSMCFWFCGVLEIVFKAVVCSGRVLCLEVWTKSFVGNARTPSNAAEVSLGQLQRCRLKRLLLQPGHFTVMCRVSNRVHCAVSRGVL